MGAARGNLDRGGAEVRQIQEHLACAQARVGRAAQVVAEPRASAKQQHEARRQTAGDFPEARGATSHGD